MIFPLVQDFADALTAMPREHPRYRILKLLDQAIRRDVHFIDRHPTTFFQCMWNTCWWYDCPEAAEHYDLAKRSTDESLPWELPAEQRLAPVLERWYDDKERQTAGFLWLQSLRPPAMQLGTSLRAVLRGHGEGVLRIAVNGDGSRVVTGSSDYTARLWDAHTGQCLLVLEGHTNLVCAVALSADGNRIVTGSVDKTARVWDSQSGQCLQVIRGYRTWPRNVAVNTDGSRVVTDGSWDTWVWDGHTGKRLLRLKGHSDGVSAMAISGDGGLVVTGSREGMVRVWDTRCDQTQLVHRGFGRWLRSLLPQRLKQGRILFELKGHDREVRSLSLSNDCKRILTGSDFDTTLMRLWDACTGRSLRTLKKQPGPSSMPSVALSGDGRRIVGWLYGGTIRVWNAESGEPMHQLRGLASNEGTVAVSDNGSCIVALFGGDVWVLEGDKGGEILKLQDHSHSIVSLAMSRDGQRIATAGADGALIWDVQAARIIRAIQDPDANATSVSLNHDGSRAVVGFANFVTKKDSAQVWDTHSGQLLLELRGHQHFVTSVAISDDGNCIVTGSIDQTARVWNGQTGACEFILKGHSKDVYRVAFCDADRKILSWSRDQTTREWNASTGECLQVHRGDVEMTGKNIPLLVANSQFLETTILEGRSQLSLAWAAAQMNDIIAHPNGRIWAGVVNGSCLSIVALNGGQFQVRPT